MLNVLKIALSHVVHQNSLNIVTMFDHLTLFALGFLRVARLGGGGGGGEGL